MTRRSYDVVIIGGAATGSSTAYFLSSNPDFSGSVAIIEKDPTFAKAATSLSASSIRHQFSNAVNVRMSQFGTQFMRDFDSTMKCTDADANIDFHENGYLFLAASDEHEQVLRANHEVQVACAADVVLFDQSELADAFPHLNVDDIRLASYGCSGEGWYSNTALMIGFRQKARQLGAHYIADEVSALYRSGRQITKVLLASGDCIDCGTVVNASGTHGADIAAMAGLSLPVEPRKRTVFVFSCERSPQGSANVNDGHLPLMIDVSGAFCRPEGECFMTGTTPENDEAVDSDDFEPRYDEFETIWKHLARRSQYFEAIRFTSSWAGHYDYNSVDQNAIIGPHSEVRNFLFANGFSGHGLQHSPAVGRAVAELIIYGQFKSIDMTELGYDRIMRNEPFVENAII